MGRDGEQGPVGVCEEGRGVCLGKRSHFCSSSQDLCYTVCSRIPLWHVPSRPWKSRNGGASGGSVVWWWHTVGQRPGRTSRLSPCRLCDSSTSLPCPACDHGRRAQGSLLTVAAVTGVTALRRHCVPSTLPAWLSLCGGSRGRWGTARDALAEGGCPQGGSRFGLQGPGAALGVGAQHSMAGDPETAEEARLFLPEVGRCHPITCPSSPGGDGVDKLSLWFRELGRARRDLYRRRKGG